MIDNARTIGILCLAIILASGLSYLVASLFEHDPYAEIGEKCPICGEPVDSQHPKHVRSDQ